MNTKKSGGDVKRGGNKCATCKSRHVGVKSASCQKPVSNHVHSAVALSAMSGREEQASWTMHHSVGRNLGGQRKGDGCSLAPCDDRKIRDNRFVLFSSFAASVKCVWGFFVSRDISLFRDLNLVSDIPFRPFPTLPHPNRHSLPSPIPQVLSLNLKNILFWWWFDIAMGQRPKQKFINRSIDRPIGGPFTHSLNQSIHSLNWSNQSNSYSVSYLFCLLLN